MILNISNICKSYDGNDILKGVSFHIEEHEKAALVGVNGAGKSTLLKIIMGLEDADSGNTVLSKDRQIGYLAQHQDLTGENTIYEQLLSVRKAIDAFAAGAPQFDDITMLSFLYWGSENDEDA